MALFNANGVLNYAVKYLNYAVIFVRISRLFYSTDHQESLHTCGLEIRTSGILNFEGMRGSEIVDEY